MPIRGSPNGANHLRPQAGRDRLEQVVAINRNAWSQSIGTTGRNHPVRAAERARLNKLQNHWLPAVRTPPHLGGIGVDRALLSSLERTGVGRSSHTASSG